MMMAGQDTINFASTHVDRDSESALSSSHESTRITRPRIIHCASSSAEKTSSPVPAAAWAATSIRKSPGPAGRWRGASKKPMSWIH